MKPYLKTILFHTYLLFSQSPIRAISAMSDEVGNANDYVDEVLQNLRNTPSYVKEFDPLKIPDFDEGNIKGSNGVVNGLSSLYRSGDCTITYEDKVATVKGEVAVRGVKLYIEYKAKALFFWISGKVHADVESLAISLVLTARDGKARLQSFKVTNLGNYKITKITGMSVVLNWLLKIIANSIAKKSRGKIIDALENGAAKAVNDILSKVDVPI